MRFWLSPTARSNVRLLCWINGAILLFIFLQIYDLLTQLYDPALMHWAVRRTEISNVSSSTGGEATQQLLIPKIIHQTYKTENIPEPWIPAQESVIEANPDYTYILWTDESAHNFISEHYPWFLKTFENYQYPIMRADAIRYFVLHYYGGFYIDLDIGLKKSLDDLRQFPSLFYKTTPTGVSNDFMASAPGHPFMAYVVKSLQKYSGNYLVPYFTVMYSTGPLFLSVLLQRFNLIHSHTGKDATRTLVLHSNPESYWQPLADYIYHVGGSTWHQGDAGLFTFMRDHLIPSVFVCIFLGFALVGTIFLIELKTVTGIQLFLRNRRRKQAAAAADTFTEYDRLKQA